MTLGNDPKIEKLRDEVQRLEAEANEVRWREYWRRKPEESPGIPGKVTGGEPPQAKGRVGRAGLGPSGSHKAGLPGSTPGPAPSPIDDLMAPRSLKDALSLNDPHQLRDAVNNPKILLSIAERERWYDLVEQWALDSPSDKVLLSRAELDVLKQVSRWRLGKPIGDDPDPTHLGGKTIIVLESKEHLASLRSEDPPAPRQWFSLNEREETTKMAMATDGACEVQREGEVWAMAEQANGSMNNLTEGLSLLMTRLDPVMQREPNPPEGTDAPDMVVSMVASKFRNLRDRS